MVKCRKNIKLDDAEKSTYCEFPCEEHSGDVRPVSIVLASGQMQPIKKNYCKNAILNAKFHGHSVIDE